MLARHPEVRGPVLDLAAGSGALLARLRDNGLADLSAVELDAPSFALPGVTPLAIDLNTDFSSAFSRHFNLITAVEIMEHLDSPRHFLHEIWKVLEPQGHLLVSTPNIAHWMGRLRFLARGELRYFKESDYQSCRHISPVNSTHMRLMLNEIGFRVIDFTTAGSFYGPLKRLLTAPVAGLFRLMNGPQTSGDTVMFLAQKTSPDSTSPGRSSIAYISRDRGVTAPG